MRRRSHVLQRRLRRDEHATDIDVNQAIHFLQRGLFERLRNGGAGIVHQHIKLAEGHNGLVDRSLHSFQRRQRPLEIATAVPPSSSIALTTAEAALASFAYVIATLAPSAARRLAIAAPMPREPP